ncbi:unnamed protein product [Timema podura]|uniref:Uncharacterized protein n=1 Tax=Timema podura TaxID=61482 RepID=A0ABN7P8Y9_TIMPD|nr:unnamed protein product [Timema podura]
MFHSSCTLSGGCHDCIRNGAQGVYHHVLYIFPCGSLLCKSYLPTNLHNASASSANHHKEKEIRKSSWNRKYIPGVIKYMAFGSRNA